jgi:hypothetical protein
MSVGFWIVRRARAYCFQSKITIYKQLRSETAGTMVAIPKPGWTYRRRRRKKIAWIWLTQKLILRMLPSVPFTIQPALGLAKATPQKPLTLRKVYQVVPSSGVQARRQYWP